MQKLLTLWRAWRKLLHLGRNKIHISIYNATMEQSTEGAYWMENIGQGKCILRNSLTYSLVMFSFHKAVCSQEIIEKENFPFNIILFIFHFIHFYFICHFSFYQNFTKSFLQSLECFNGIIFEKLFSFLKFSYELFKAVWEV